MLKYLTTKNIENHKYQIAKNLNSNLTQEESQIYRNCDNFIQKSKYITRIYFFGELLYLTYNLLYKKVGSILHKSTFMIIRINIAWVLSNIATNLYLESNIPKDIKRNNQFKKYIVNKF